MAKKKMAKKIAAKKSKLTQSRQKIIKASKMGETTPSINDLINALYVALHKDGMDAVIECLEVELNVHRMELDDKAKRPDIMTTYELIQSFEKEAKAKKKKKK